MSTVKAEHLCDVFCLAPWSPLANPHHTLPTTTTHQGSPEAGRDCPISYRYMDLVNFHNGSSQLSLIFYINICNFIGQLLSNLSSLPRFPQVKELYLLHNKLFICRYLLKVF